MSSTCGPGDIRCPELSTQSIAKRLALGALLSLLLAGTVNMAHAQEGVSDPEQPAFSGLDESINEALAEEAGVPSRDPIINVEAMGELWNLLLLAGGAVCGFIVGRYWDQIWGRRPGQQQK